MTTRVQSYKGATTPDNLQPSEASYYGPDHCVMAYRRPDGNCQMETRCKASAIENYEFGLTCVNKKNTVRHLFGQKSFKPEENFNTLIPCDLCLGVDADNNEFNAQA